MNQIHPGEEKLQQYSLERSTIDAKTLNHIKHCELCMNKVRIYETLFSSIKEQPSPVFEFDLSQAVLAKLPRTELKYSSDNKLLYAIMGCIVLFLVVTGLVLNEFYPGLFSKANTILIYLMLLTIAIVFLFHVTEIIKNYQKKIKALDFT